MGSFISIGIVYTDKNIIKMGDDLVDIIKYLSPFCNKIVVNYPDDDICENWEEKSFVGEEGFEKAFSILNDKKFSTGKIYCKIQNKDYNVLVSIKGKNDLFRGILFEIPEEELFLEKFSSDILDIITDKIANSIIELWNNTEFNYAFCDSEADIEYSLCEVRASEKPIYSMLLLKNEFNQPIVRLGSWCIDGLTPRK
ncbi:Imm64 family immunity protein [Candidatus Galacturonibacter soehngenii]|uniref:Uncharacterized protein n=1 Tax=Candidatus Galacturonatibacter soehngenii TaxID=2307010 RepID=A0A7V7UBK9_9FIRM|nr:Imm64 family immunity protein [Candidatus Galacturonibacter soehngenii]KAB1438065.1 hypothetical protein F7O84_10915 [Candidatus Galacturonibacter soehngenii]